MSRDRELMILHVEALYVHDPIGRLVRVNAHDGPPAPRFFLGRTADGAVRRYRHDVDDALRLALEAAAHDDARPHPAGDAAAEAEADLARYATLLARGGVVRHTWAGPAFRFPRRLPATGEAVVLVTERNASLLHPLLAA